MKPGIFMAGRLRRPASAVLLLITCLSLSALAHGQPAEPPLTLQTAVTRALNQHPGLQVFHLLQKSLENRRRSAALAPALRLEAEIEKFAGQGDMQGFSNSEQTLALSSVIELGGKSAARVAAMDARSGRVGAERQIQALDLINRVTQSFIDVLATQQRLEVTESALALAEITLEAVQKRTSAGAAPEAEVLRARAAKTQAVLAVTRVQRDIESHKVTLAALMGSPRTEIGPIAGDLFQLPPADSFKALYQRARKNPVMDAFSDELRLREAQLQLAESQGDSDIGWRLGVRREQQTGDAGVVAGISVPLFSGKRARSEVMSARAEREQVHLRRRQALNRMHAELYRAYASRQQAIDAVQGLQTQIIPALTEALQITQRAYENGRYSYIDWVAAQHELLNARLELIATAASALSYGAAIEQFTAEPLSTSPRTRP